MAIFTYQAGWKALKGLFINSSGSTYSNAKSGWVYNGTNWNIMYPEVPVNLVLPVISGVVAYSNTVTVDTGTWNEDAAHIGVYTYQWYRNSVAISGATTNSYGITSSDIGTNLSVKVTSTNGRGAITVSSASSYVLTKITTTPSVSDVTPVPANPSSLVGAAGVDPYLWSLTFTLGSNTTSSAVTQTGTGGSITYSSLGTTATGNSNGTAPAVVTVTSSNTSYQIKVTNYKALGADSYDIKLDNGSYVNTTNDGTGVNGYVITGVAAGAHTVTIVPKLGTNAGVGATSGSVTPTTKTSFATANITVKELGQIPTVFVSDTTASVTTPTVGLAEGNEQTWSAAWTAVPNATSYGGGLSSGTISTFDTSARTASGTASGGAVTFSVYATNTSKQITATWANQPGATTYYGKLDSGVETDLGFVSSVVYPVSDTNNHTITITPYAGTYRGKSTQSGSVSAADKTSTSGSASGSWTVVTSVSPSGNVLKGVTTVSWTTSGQPQAKYSLSMPGTTLDGATGNTVQNRSFTAVAGTTYTLTVYAYKSTNSSYTSGSTSFTAINPPLTDPGTPTLSYLSANTSSWNYSATWSGSTGGVTPYKYYLSAVGSVGGSTTKGPFSSTSSGTFTLPRTDTTWQVAVYTIDAANTVSGTSGYSNSA